MFIDVTDCRNCNKCINIASIVLVSEANEESIKLYPNCGAEIWLVGCDEAIAVMDDYEDIVKQIYDGGNMYA